MATKLTVKTEVGTFTRTTARTYTHIVVAVGGYSQAYTARLRVGAADFEAAQAVKPEGDDAYRSCFNREGIEKKIAAAAERVAVLGWAGRLDLARKVQAGYLAGLHADVRIYEIATGARVR